MRKIVVLIIVGASVAGAALLATVAAASGPLQQAATAASSPPVVQSQQVASPAQSATPAVPVETVQKGQHDETSHAHKPGTMHQGGGSGKPPHDPASCPCHSGGKAAPAKGK